MSIVMGHKVPTGECGRPYSLLGLGTLATGKMHIWAACCHWPGVGAKTLYTDVPEAMVVG